jgi:hypothetical protein
MNTRQAIIALLAVTITACGQIDSMKEGFAHSEAVSKNLEKSLGVKPFVGFNWYNGSLTSVNVTFQGIPPNTALADITEKSKQAVVAEFQQTPTEIVVAFRVTP